MTYNEKRAYLESFEQIEKRCAELRAEMKQSEQIEEVLKKEESNLVEHLRVIENALYSLPDVCARRILWLRYIGEIHHGRRVRLKHLWQIANKVGYSEETVKKKHTKAIRDIVF
jgi:predicted  nucleic acid-binding Zn-ribbon protein